MNTSKTKTDAHSKSPIQFKGACPHSHACPNKRLPKPNPTILLTETALSLSCSPFLLVPNPSFLFSFKTKKTTKSRTCQSPRGDLQVVVSDKTSKAPRACQQSETNPWGPPRKTKLHSGVMVSSLSLCSILSPSCSSGFTVRIGPSTSRICALISALSLMKVNPCTAESG